MSEYQKMGLAYPLIIYREDIHAPGLACIDNDPVKSTHEQLKDRQPIFDKVQNYDAPGLALKSYVYELYV